jgi:predicted nucleic acid-binding protein
MSEQGVVMDASAAVALVAIGLQAAAVERLLSAWNAQDRLVLVPSFFWLEVVNTLLRQHHWSGADTLEAIHRMDTYGLETVEQDRALIISALDLAERHRLSAYDAAYLALAIRLDAQLPTLDHQLATAAGERAVKLGDGRISETGPTYAREPTWPSYRGASAYLAKLRAEALSAKPQVVGARQSPPQMPSSEQ